LAAVEQAALERPVAPARQALSADEQATGQAMTREQTVTDALEAPLSEPRAPLHHPPERQQTAAPARRRRSQTQRQECALVHLRTVGALSPRAYADVFRVSIDTALRDLRELVDRDLVRAAGTTRDRRYVLAGDAGGPAPHRGAP
jgi:predicted HTH transcriptional regulator